MGIASRLLIQDAHLWRRALFIARKLDESVLRTTAIFGLSA